MAVIDYADSSRFAEVMRLYEINGYRGGIDPGDIVVVASASHQLVGALRLCREHDVLVLRGMQILNRYQGQSIGSQMLRFCATTLNMQDGYCLPYSHLVGFYSQIGFTVAAESALPQFLAERLARYRDSGLDVIGMTRAAGLG